MRNSSLRRRSWAKISSLRANSNQKMPKDLTNRCSRFSKTARSSHGGQTPGGNQIPNLSLNQMMPSLGQGYVPMQTGSFTPNFLGNYMPPETPSVLRSNPNFDINPMTSSMIPKQQSLKTGDARGSVRADGRRLPPSNKLNRLMGDHRGGRGNPTFECGGDGDGSDRSVISFGNDGDAGSSDFVFDDENIDIAAQARELEFYEQYPALNRFSKPSADGNSKSTKATSSKSLRPTPSPRQIVQPSAMSSRSSSTGDDKNSRLRNCMPNILSRRDAMMASQINAAVAVQVNSAFQNVVNQMQQVVQAEMQRGLQDFQQQLLARFPNSNSGGPGFERRRSTPRSGNANLADKRCRPSTSLDKNDPCDDDPEDDDSSGSDVLPALDPDIQHSDEEGGTARREPLNQTKIRSRVISGLERQFKVAKIDTQHLETALSMTPTLTSIVAGGSGNRRIAKAADDLTKRVMLTETWKKFCHAYGGVAQNPMKLIASKTNLNGQVCVLVSAVQSATPPPISTQSSMMEVILKSLRSQSIGPAVTAALERLQKERCLCSLPELGHAVVIGLKHKLATKTRDELYDAFLQYSRNNKGSILFNKMVATIHRNVEKGYDHIAWLAIELETMEAVFKKKREVTLADWAKENHVSPAVANEQVLPTFSHAACEVFGEVFAAYAKKMRVEQGLERYLAEAGDDNEYLKYEKSTDVAEPADYDYIQWEQAGPNMSAKHQTILMDKRVLYRQLDLSSLSAQLNDLSDQESGRTLMQPLIDEIEATHKDTLLDADTVIRHLEQIQKSVLLLRGSLQIKEKVAAALSEWKQASKKPLPLLYLVKTRDVAVSAFWVEERFAKKIATEQYQRMNEDVQKGVPPASSIIKKMTDDPWLSGMDQLAKAALLAAHMASSFSTTVPHIDTINTYIASETNSDRTIAEDLGEEQPKSPVTEKAVLGAFRILSDNLAKQLKKVNLADKNEEALRNHHIQLAARSTLIESIPILSNEKPINVKKDVAAALQAFDKVEDEDLGTAKTQTLEEGDDDVEEADKSGPKVSSFLSTPQGNEAGDRKENKKKEGKKTAPAQKNKKRKSSTTQKEEGGGKKEIPIKKENNAKRRRKHGLASKLKMDVDPKENHSDLDMGVSESDGDLFESRDDEEIRLKPGYGIDGNEPQEDDDEGPFAFLVKNRGR